MVLIEPDDDRWHDKSLNGRVFTCEHCGEEGHAWEADARCDECGKTTLLAIEIPKEHLD